MQSVILTGGLATRLRPLTARVAKAMLDVCGRPFLEHQIELLRGNGVTDLVLCVGHLAAQIRSYFGDGRAWGVRIRYSDDGRSLMGTAGALRQAEPLLRHAFFVLDGDAYLSLDYRELMSDFKRASTLALMVVYKNCGRYGRSNVIIDSGKVKVYDRISDVPGMIHIHAGLSVLSRQALALIPPDRPAPQDALWSRLISQDELSAFESSARFYEIGSRKGLEEFRRLMGRRRRPG